MRGGYIQQTYETRAYRVVCKVSCLILPHFSYYSRHCRGRRRCDEYHAMRGFCYIKLCKISYLPAFVSNLFETHHLRYYISTHTHMNTWDIRLMYRAQGNSCVKGYVFFVLLFALPSLFSPSPLCVAILKRKQALNL